MIWVSVAESEVCKDPIRQSMSAYVPQAWLILKFIPLVLVQETHSIRLTLKQHCFDMFAGI